MKKKNKPIGVAQAMQQGAPQPGKTGKKDRGRMPPAGPHADPRLMNPDATPGTGALPPIGSEDDANMGSTG
ncbi:hypothetical protein [Rhodoligotrophos defluvii]|uniref:hypothetical protein n=1 Tax=Rhodoligotrophos defluvii TaxID=2561934 RepID=UPI0010C936FB|nr:hypothetical protein [Rhodoligotrophos defluvii]